MYTPNIKESKYLSTYSHKQVYTLDFSHSPSGTHKYLRSQQIVEEAISKNADRICLLTAGNAGLALLQEVEKVNAAREKNIFLSFIIDNNMPKERVTALQSPYVTIIQKNLDEKFLNTSELIALSRESKDEIIIDATNVISIDVSEIVSQCATLSIDTAILPIGSGEFYLSLWNEIKRMQLSLQLIGVVPKNGHPLCVRAIASLEDFYQSYEYNSLTPSLSFSLMPNNVRNLLLQSMNDNHAFIDVDDVAIKTAYTLSINAGFDVEASASVALSPLQSEILHGKKRILCILTGKSGVER